MVNPEEVKKAISQLSEQSQKKFDQRVEFIVTLKDFNPKKDKVDFFSTLNYSPGKEIKICGLVGPELADESRKIFDMTIVQSEFAELAKTPAKLKKIANDHDFFVAQANVMQQVAATFGRVLGPRGKMPNPKAGCVVPPKAQLQPVADRLKKTIHVRNRESPMVQIGVGRQGQDVKEIVDNVNHVYDGLLHQLPLEVNNVKAVFVKFTMSPVVKVM